MQVIDEDGNIRRLGDVPRWEYNRARNAAIWHREWAAWVRYWQGPIPENETDEERVKRETILNRRVTICTICSIFGIFALFGVGYILLMVDATIGF